MNFGLVDETVKTNYLKEICLKEIKDCQELSAGPSFLVLS